MPISYPTSLDVFTNPNSATDNLDSVTVPHATQHGNANDAIEALEAKVGISASTPVANSFLVGTSAGVSSWSTAVTMGGAINCANNIISNIGAAGTDFTATGGLTLADTLIVSVGGIKSSDTTSWYLNDSANAKMTTGLTINQGAADNEILALKSSDVAHGITDVTETDTYGFFKKSSAIGGTLVVEGLASATTGLTLNGTHTTDHTVKTVSANGAINMNARLKSGTGLAIPGADANLVVIQSHGNTRFIFDQEGSGHADIEFVAFDHYDDIALIDGLTHQFVRHTSHTRITTEFGQWLTGQRQALEQAGIVGRGSWHVENGQHRAMVNFSRLSMLFAGALRQVGGRLAALEERVGLRPGYRPLLEG